MSEELIQFGHSLGDDYWLLRMLICLGTFSLMGRPWPVWCESVQNRSRPCLPALVQISMCLTDTAAIMSKVTGITDLADFTDSRSLAWQYNCHFSHTVDLEWFIMLGVLVLERLNPPVVLWSIFVSTILYALLTSKPILVNSDPGRQYKG